MSIKTQFLALPDRLVQMLETVTTPRDRREMMVQEVETILTAIADNRALPPETDKA